MNEAEKQKFVVTDAPLVFFDTELTGLDLSHEVIQIGFLKVDPKTFEVLSEGDIKMHPQRLADADPEGLRISGYSEEAWKDAVSLEEGLKEFLMHTEGAVLVGHNLPIDWMHLKNSLEKVDLTPNYYYKGLDTFSLAWQLLRGNAAFKTFSLSELTAFFDIDPGEKHRALDDARATYKIFMALMKYKEEE